MRAEVAGQSSAIETLRRNPGSINRFVSGPNQENEVTKLSASLIPSGWYYQNALWSARIVLEDFVPIADTSKGTISPAMARQTAAIVRGLPHGFETILARMMLPGLENCPRRFALGQSGADLARAACGLERYRLAHGRYPNSLDDVAPLLSGGVPHDVIDGSPLHYRPTDDGLFVLYSVGWNEKDDGGTVALAKGGVVDQDRGDWVWKYPD